MTRSMALEWGTYGIRVVGVAPGPIKGTPGEQVRVPRESIVPGIDCHSYTNNPRAAAWAGAPRASCYMAGRACELWGKMPLRS